MTFFKSKNQALLFTSGNLVLAAIPFVNFAIAAGAAMADGAGNTMDAYEARLKNFIIYASISYVPALLLLPFSLIVFACTAIASLFENNTKPATTPTCC